MTDQVARDMAVPSLVADELRAEAAPQAASAAHRVPAAVTAADEILLPLVCPACGATGRVPVSRITHGMRCRRCACNFIVASDGGVIAADELPQVPYHCPRCDSHGLLPSVLATHAKCPGCALPLALGADGRLRGVEEARAAQQAANSQAAQRTARERALARSIPSAAAGSVDDRRRWPWVALGGALALAIVLAWWFRSSTNSVVAVERFNHACLAGDWEAAAAFLPDDAVQRAEFRRWRIRHYPSIQDRFRPAGDRITVLTQALDPAKPGTLAVTLKSPFLGERTHTECWQVAGSHWRFDVVATLSQEEQPATGGLHGASPAGVAE